MKQILLMRHAKSDHGMGMPDHERPLNARGERDAPAMGARLAAMGVLPDEIVSSTAVRARETARLFAGAAGFPGTIRQDKRLYLASPEDFLEVIAEADPSCERLMLVSHNPGSEELLHVLCHEEREMPTAAIALMELDAENWEACRHRPKAKLLHFWTPKAV